MSPKVLWDVVRAAAARAGIDKLAPHDLRRTCARLRHVAGGELDQIQFLLGHVSIQTGANAEEAKSAYSRRDFACKNALVLREAREASYWLRLLQATQLAPTDSLRPLISEASELVAIYAVAVRRARLPRAETQNLNARTMKD